MRRIAVAAVSARALAEQAAREGFEVVALDCFGDRDTRRAAARWLPIGDAASLRIDEQRLIAGLEALARSGAAQAWIVGSGFDGRADLLAEGAKRLPLIGNDAATVRRVRDPRRFFDTLDAHGIAHPPVRFEGAAAPGWLVKDSAGCGGLQVRRAADAPGALGPMQYLQREQAGTPLSATFVANGRAAVVLGCNEQIVQPQGEAPFVYGGVIGPLPPDAALQRTVEAALAAIVPAFGLRGLGSLDLLRDGDAVSVLELNPRPSASVSLYAGCEPLRSHVRACRDGTLPPAPSAPALHGTRTVFTRRALTLDARAADWLAAQPDTRDLPAPGGFGRGQPLCSVQSDDGGANPADLRRRLAARCNALLGALESAP